jgi:hypothetical protein
MPQVSKNVLFYETIHTILKKKPRPKPGLFVWTVSYDYWLLTFNSTRLFCACSALVLPLFNGLLGP